MVSSEHKSAGFALCMVAAALAVVLGNTAASAQSSEPPASRIAAGDKLSVKVFGQPDLSGEFLVDGSGNVRVPLAGDVPAAALTLSELEQAIIARLENGYLRGATVSVLMAELRPVHVLGGVRTPGLYPYRHGMTVLAAIAAAGGIGHASSRQGVVVGELLQAEERIRVLEANRTAIVARRARLTAQQGGQDSVDFSAVPRGRLEAAKVSQILESERRIFASENEARKQENALLESQIPRLRAEIASLMEQRTLELRQQQLHRQQVQDYEKLMNSGLGRKPAYVDIKREEARIEANLVRLTSERLKADLAIGDVEFKIAESKNNYDRRIANEAQEANKLLFELDITIPGAVRARDARVRELGALAEVAAGQPSIRVMRQENGKTTESEAALDLALAPGDIVQIGPLFTGEAVAEAGSSAGHTTERHLSAVGTRQ